MLPVSRLIAAITATAAWNMSICWLLAATLSGLINAVDILITVFGALLILQLPRKSDAISSISRSMAAVS